MVNYDALYTTMNDISNIVKKIPSALRFYADYSGKVGRQSQMKYRAVIDTWVPATGEGLVWEFITLVPPANTMNGFREALSNLPPSEFLGILLGIPALFVVGRTLHSLYEFNKK